MHYRNGREAKNGDKVLQLNGGVPAKIGVLHDARADGGSHCNGDLAQIPPSGTYACLCDCIHVDDLAELLAKAGLDRRPEGM